MSFGARDLSVVGCPLFGSCKCIASTGIAVGTSAVVRYPGDVRYWECPLSEFLLYNIYIWNVIVPCLGTIQVSSNGYISMAVFPNEDSPTIPGTTDIVSPYGANIDTSDGGRIRYTLFSNVNSETGVVNKFIQDQTGTSFFGETLMVAEWDSVPLYNRDSVSVSSLFV